MLTWRASSGVRPPATIERRATFESLHSDPANSTKDRLLHMTAPSPLRPPSPTASFPGVACRAIRQANAVPPFPSLPCMRLPSPPLPSAAGEGVGGSMRASVPRCTMNLTRRCPKCAGLSFARGLWKCEWACMHRRLPALRSSATHSSTLRMHTAAAPCSWCVWASKEMTRPRLLSLLSPMSRSLTSSAHTHREGRRE